MTRKVIDWEAVELQYRAGIRSLKDIGGEFGVSDAAIIKRAKRDGWTRDLQAKIQAKADAKVSAALVSVEVSAQTKATERQVIEANAEAVANVKMAHRRDIGRARNIVNSLLDELEVMVGQEQVERLVEMGELLRREDESGKDRLNDLYHQIISLPGRSKAMKDMTASLQALVGMERTAYGMDDKHLAAAGGVVKDMTDAERAVRLANLLKSPNAAGALAQVMGAAK